MHGIGEGNGNPLQYSCLENPRDKGASWAAVYGVAQSWTRLKRLSSSSSSITSHKHKNKEKKKYLGIKIPRRCWWKKLLLLLLLSQSVVSNSVRLHRWQPTRLPHPWDSPGKNTGVGCHFLLQCRKEKSESEVVQSCPTLCDPMDCSLPGSSIHGISQARVLEWGAIAFSGKKLKMTQINRKICCAH